MTRAADRLMVCGAEGAGQAAGRLLVRPGRDALEPLASEETGRRWQHGLRLRQRRMRTGRSNSNSRGAERPITVPAWLERARSAEAGAAHARIITPSGRRSMDASRRSAAAIATRLRARPSRAPAAAVAARHSAGAGGMPRPGGISHGPAEAFTRDEREQMLADRCSPCSTIRASRRCSRPAAAPRCRSSGASRATDGPPLRCPARSIASRSPPRPC